MTPQQLTATEEEIRSLWEQVEIPYLLHLEGSKDGSFERWLCDFFAANIKPTDWVLASHRCHFVWQLHEYYRNKEKSQRWAGDGTHAAAFEFTKGLLLDKIKHGKSMFLYGPRFLCSAIVAGTASIAAGLALSIQQRGGTEQVWFFGGDGNEDHGHFYESVRLVHGRKLPCTFIITDNNSSCGVTKEQRGSPDDWQWPDCVVRVKYEPAFPHAGSFVRPNLKLKP